MLWGWISIRARCTTLCDKVCQWLATGRWYSPGTLVSSNYKTDHHDITEILSRFKLTTSVVIGTDGTIFKHYICLKAYCLPNGKIVIFSYPKLLSFSVLTFIEWRLTPSYAPYIYPAFVPFERYFTSIHLSLWIRQCPLSSTRWHFRFCPRTTCCLLLVRSDYYIGICFTQTNTNIIVWPDQ
jgi:hypothetical protein